MENAIAADNNKSNISRIYILKDKTVFYQNTVDFAKKLRQKTKRQKTDNYVSNSY